MKSINLNNWHEQAIVDDDDYQYLSKYKWFARKPEKNKKAVYAVRAPEKSIGEKSPVRMHRQIMTPDRRFQIDHINGNGLDNRKSNLRLCDNSQNNCNRGIKSTNRSGFKGVYWSKKVNKWASLIEARGVKYPLGYFDDPKNAAIAYNKAALEYHGNFARLNEIE